MAQNKHGNTAFSSGFAGILGSENVENTPTAI
jgi:hypothetical protein